MKFFFILTILALWLSIIGYLLLRTYQTFAPYPTVKWICLLAISIAFLAFIAGMFFGNIFPIVFAKPVSFIGYSFLILTVYLFLTYFIVDILRIIHYFLPFAVDMAKLRIWSVVVMVISIAAVMTAGHIKFNHPQIVTLNIESSKPHQGKEMKIVAVSDLHLGISVDKRRLKKYVELINAQQPDLALIAGDLIDRSLKPVIEQKMNEDLRLIKAPMGVGAVFGNHEYYGEGGKDIVDFYKSANITLLRDSSMLVNDALYIVGRDDMTNKNRKELARLTENLDKSKPIILLDHQPFNLHDATSAQVDLQLSGHTHNGQFFPINVIVKKMFEKGYGYLKKGDTHIYVSSGLGLWGPQYRIGTQSEIVVVNFKY